MSKEIDLFVYYSFPAFRTKPRNVKRLTPLDKFIAKMYETHPFDKVEVWHIEFHKELNTVTRELGFDGSGELIYLAPTQRNFGFWSDTNITLAEYERFYPDTISKTRFNRLFREAKA